MWRKWRSPEEWHENMDREQCRTYIKELASRKIKVRQGPDILRWGKSTRGTYSVKEAYYLTTDHEREEEAIDWKEIWNRTRPQTQKQSAYQFRYPSQPFIKLNFDGASKGNPGPAGFGGIFRDYKNQTRWVYAEGGGEMKKNEAELWAVCQGLRIAVRNGYMNLEIEGDS
eukprot:PITA_27544